MSKKDEVMIIKDFQEIGKVITRVINNDSGSETIDFSKASLQEKRRMIDFLEGGVYALDGELSMEGDICEIKVKQDLIYNFIECYYGSTNQEDIEEILYPETNIRKIIDKFINGQMIILDFSRLPDETAKEYFNKVCGATYALRGNISKSSESENIYVFTPAIKVTKGILGAIIKENNHNIASLTTDESKVQEVKGLFEKNISLYDTNKILTDDRLRYAEFLERKGLVAEAIKQVEELCILHINYDMRTHGLFKRALIKCLELKCFQNGVEAAESFANKLIEQCMACKDSSYLAIIYNETVSLLIQNKKSRQALKKIKKAKANLDKDTGFSTSQFNFLTAKALFNCGHFKRSLSLINKKLNDKDNLYYVEGLRLKAAIYSKRGQVGKAIDTYELLIKIYDSKPEFYSIHVYSMDCGALANHYLDLKKDKLNAYNRAIELYELGIEHCIGKNQSDKERATHFHNLGAAYKKLYLIQGNEELLEKAKAAFIGAMNIYMESTNPYIDNCENMLSTLEFLDEIIKEERKLESKL